MNHDDLEVIFPRCLEKNVSEKNRGNISQNSAM